MLGSTFMLVKVGMKTIVVEIGSKASSSSTSI